VAGVFISDSSRPHESLKRQRRDKGISFACASGFNDARRATTLGNPPITHHPPPVTRHPPPGQESLIAVIKYSDCIDANGRTGCEGEVLVSWVS
jgi:hypothetical protein